MEAAIRTYFKNIYAQDRPLQNEAYACLMTITEKPVPWAYEVWDELMKALKHADNHVRAIAAQLLCNLALSDPEQRMVKDMEALWLVTKDERFVTARHCLQSMWKIGLAGETQRKKLLQGLERRFENCLSEKNWTMIRGDILICLKQVYETTEDESAKETALRLIKSEQDPKYFKKFAAIWKVK